MRSHYFSSSCGRSHFLLNFSSLFSTSNKKAIVLRSLGTAVTDGYLRESALPRQIADNAKKPRNTCPCPVREECLLFSKYSGLASLSHVSHVMSSLDYLSKWHWSSGFSVQTCWPLRIRKIWVILLDHFCLRRIPPYDILSRHSLPFVLIREGGGGGDPYPQDKNWKGQRDDDEEEGKGCLATNMTWSSLRRSQEGGLCLCEHPLCAPGRGEQ